MTARPIKTAFYDRHGNVVHVNSALHPNPAIDKCAGLLKREVYTGAYSVEVYNEVTGQAHAAARLTPKGEVLTSFKVDPNEFQPMRLAYGALVIPVTKKKGKKS